MVEGFNRNTDISTTSRAGQITEQVLSSTGGLGETVLFWKVRAVRTL